MSLFSIFGYKKQEALKTDDLRRTTRAEVAAAKDALNNKFEKLASLVDDALVELRVPAPSKQRLHSKRKQ